jgi:hypothetical protein
MADLAHGQSIAIDGVDLTVTSLAENAFSANVMAETYRRSTLARMAAGTRVNLGRAALPATRLSGHIVRGRRFSRLLSPKARLPSTLAAHSSDDTSCRAMDSGDTTCHR